MLTDGGTPRRIRIVWYREPKSEWAASRRHVERHIVLVSGLMRSCAIRCLHAPQDNVVRPMAATRLPLQSGLETANSVETFPQVVVSSTPRARLRRSLLVSRMLGASPTVPITNTLSPVEVEHLLGQLEPLAGGELGQAQTGAANPELALPVEGALPLLGRLDAG